LSLSIAIVVAAISIMVAIAVMIAITIVVPIPVTSASFDHEISPAAVIHPNAPVIRAPTIAFSTGGLTALLHQPSSARRVR